MGRTLVISFPDWPVSAATHAAGVPAAGPVAVLDRGRVFSCSSAARSNGVRRGQRIRDAQARCPELLVLRHDPVVEARAFEPIVAAVEQFAPGVESIRPGSCALAAHGPTRYFGGEVSMLACLGGHLGALLAGEPIADHLGQFHLGLADGAFAAAAAAAQARRDGLPALRIEPGGSAAFLAPLDIALIGCPELVDLLRRLGIRTLGAFAQLPSRSVGSRFGVEGAAAHRLAGGLENRGLSVRRPPSELTVELSLEPPVDRVETVAFTAGGTADRLIAGLSARDLVCTCLRIEVRSEHGEQISRLWRHPSWFTAADVLDRIRWQLQGTVGRPTGLTGAITMIRLVPEEAEPIADHHAGLWGDAMPDERVHRVLSRVQSMLGHTAVVTAAPVGGRNYPDRLELVPWGDSSVAAEGAGIRTTPRRPAATRRSAPGIAARIRAQRPSWPGRLPAPAPAWVLTVSRPARLSDDSGWPVSVGERQLLSAAPCRLEVADRDGRFTAAGFAAPVSGWAGPWVTDERAWDPVTARRQGRLQVICEDGTAWLLVFENDGWSVVARYD